MKRAVLALAALSLEAAQPVFIPIPGAAQPFSIARTETTVEQFENFVKKTGYPTEAEKAGAGRTWRSPGFALHPKQPVVYVTPTDAAAYCESIGARLPTDLEWELAARAGSSTRHYWGDAIDGRYLWYRANSDHRPQPVAKKRPNASGLYDMEGNVWEWSLSEPDNGAAMANRRGGSWVACEYIDGGPGKPPSPLIAISTAYKSRVATAHRYDDIGFRCARSGPATQSSSK